MQVTKLESYVASAPQPQQAAELLLQAQRYGAASLGDRRQLCEAVVALLGGGGGAPSSSSAAAAFGPATGGGPATFRSSRDRWDAAHALPCSSPCLHCA